MTHLVVTFGSPANLLFPSAFSSRPDPARLPPDNKSRRLSVPRSPEVWRFGSGLAYGTKEKDSQVLTNSLVVGGGEDPGLSLRGYLKVSVQLAAFSFH